MHGCTTLLLVLSVPVLQAIGSDQRMPSPLAVLQRVMAQTSLSGAGGELDSALPTVPITPCMTIQLLLLLATVLNFATDVSSPLWPSLVALVASWTHTRFFRPAPKHSQGLPSTSEGTSSGSIMLRGDRSEGLQFAKLFPGPLRPAVQAVTSPVGGVCLRWRLWNLAAPQRSESERRDGRAAADALFSFSGNDEGDAAAASGFVGLGAAGYTTAASASGFAGSNTASAAASVKDPVAERRRARALQLLDAKLAQMGGGGTTVPAAAAATGKAGASNGGVGATAGGVQPTKPAGQASKPAAADATTTASSGT